jgi:hypothetical protein
VSATAVRVRLVVSSALVLLLELALIRWTGERIVHLSYFNNFVLIGSFLGIGLGFLRGPRSDRWPTYSLVALAFLAAVVTIAPVKVDVSSSDALYFTNVSVTGPPIWVTLPLIFITVATIMMGPAELVARSFSQLPRLEAYRYDLIGSLLGTGLFALLAFWRTPPLVWGGVAVLTFLALRGRRPSLGSAMAGLIVLAVLTGESFASNTYWSPYYDIQVHTSGSGRNFSMLVEANGVPHQEVLAARRRLRLEPAYGVPYERATTKPRDVLVIGAGTGTDVAIALLKGAQHVDAVEIDPVLAQLGDRNPDHPYSNPRVTLHIEDGRTFLEQTKRRYDLILFALPDSLTLVPGASQLRLESFLLTTQAFRAARDRLAPGGAFAVYNYFRTQWLVNRLASTAQQAFGHRPCVDQTVTQSVITVGLTAADQRCAKPWSLPRTGTPPPATDDQPFPYLERQAIPQIDLLVLVMILAVSVLAVRRAGVGFSKLGGYADLFLLGTGFMLLETSNVTRFALLFGTTWVVNAMVFGGILLAVLAAVEVTRRWPTPSIAVLYGLLVAALAASWLVPSSALLSLPTASRLAVAAVIAFLPVFAVNIVFAKRLAEAGDGTIAFGANLLGGVLGGCLEYASLITGYNALLLVAAAIYLGAFAVLRLRGTDFARRLARLGATVGPALALVAVWTLMSSANRSQVCCDVGLYHLYAHNVFDLHQFPYRDFFFEYPPGVLLPILLPGLVSTANATTYWVVFEVLMVLSLLTIQASARRLGGARAAWLVALVPLLTGPLARDRFDLFPLALMTAGLAVLAGAHGEAITRRRLFGAMMLLGLGTATKVFPAIGALAVIAWLLGRGDRRAAAAAAGVFVLTVAAIVLPFAVIGGHGFIKGALFQTERPVQVESTAAMVIRLLGGGTLTGSYRSSSLQGGPTDLVAATFAALQAAAILAALASAAWVGRRGGRPRDLTLAVLAGVVAYMCLGKVLSPQYVLWVAPLAPLAWVFRQRVVAILLAVAAGMTQWLFPAHYTETVIGTGPGITVTALRDLVLVLVLVLLLGSALRRRPTSSALLARPPGDVVTAAHPG